jgi:hypothetical protein
MNKVIDRQENLWSVAKTYEYSDAQILRLKQAIHPYFISDVTSHTNEIGRPNDVAGNIARLAQKTRDNLQAEANNFEPFLQNLFVNTDHDLYHYVSDLIEEYMAMCLEVCASETTGVADTDTDSD